MTTILVGVDQSERSRDAVAFAHALGGNPSARALVANVFRRDDHPSGALKLDYRRALERDAERTADRMADELRELDADRVAAATVAGTSPPTGCSISPSSGARQS